jgi:CelD/BcsL family acetyltransferase involved in cellulose biosynthesis
MADMITLEVAAGCAAVGPDWEPLFAAGPDVQSSRAWFETVEQAALPAGARAVVLLVRHAGRPWALLPMLQGPGRQMRSLTSPYTVLFQPLLAADADPAAVGAAIGRHLRRWPVVRLEALDPAWPGLEPMLTGFRAAGLVASRYDHFGNWHQDLAGLDWPAYLALRPGALRETIRRRGRAAAKDPTVRIEVVRGSDRLDAALAAYETVYAKSWKEPEPYPRFNDMLLPRLAELGVMRLCVMWQGDAPLAAQYWTVRGGVATVLKLAHDDAARALSPGTILTAHMIKTLMEEDGVHALDFGRGDDPYKQSWTDVRRQRVGVVLINPRRPAGLMELARHGAGLLRRMVRDLRAKA